MRPVKLTVREDDKQQTNADRRRRKPGHHSRVISSAASNTMSNSTTMTSLSGVAVDFRSSDCACADSTSRESVSVLAAITQWHVRLRASDDDLLSRTRALVDDLTQAVCLPCVRCVRCVKISRNARIARNAGDF